MEKLTRNYIGLTLLFTSMILTVVDFTSFIIVNIMSMIAFFFTDQITKYIGDVEKKQAEEDEFRKIADEHQKKLFDNDNAKF